MYNIMSCVGCNYAMSWVILYDGGLMHDVVWLALWFMCGYVMWLMRIAVVIGVVCVLIIVCIAMCVMCRLM